MTGHHRPYRSLLYQNSRAGASGILSIEPYPTYPQQSPSNPPIVPYAFRNPGRERFTSV
mgnify:CR=1 FL=1